MSTDHDQGEQSGPAGQGGQAGIHPASRGLLRDRRFAPMFWVQFAGAANDNVFKYAFTLLATYAAAQWGGLDPRMAGFVIGGLFIAPYLLFSATSGQLADKLEKSWLIKRVKEAEIAIMALAALGLLLRLPAVLYGCVFLMGLHSTLFGPVKYAYMPQQLEPEELVEGNGLIEMGTFVAILAGTIGAGLLADRFGAGAPVAVAVAVLCIALFGRIVAGFVPRSPAADPALRLNWNPLSETWTNLRLARRQPAIFNSLLGISWLWFFGSIFLTSFPSLTREVIGGTVSVSTLLLATFSIGIGAGSMLCDRLSGRKVEIGLVPLGSIGMTVFAIDLYLATRGFSPLHEAGIAGFLSTAAAWRILIDMFLLAGFAGLYSVPLYALIQSRSEKTHTARIIAANNILNAVFMIIASLMAAALLSSGFSIPQLFLVTAVLNAAVAIHIYRLVPEFLLRFLAWLVAHVLYRLRIEGQARIPSHGAALLVCNHVSFVDAIVLMGASPRPIRFVMDHQIFSIPLLGVFFRQAKAIPIAPRDADPALFQRSNDAIDAALSEGELVCIFPEGRITDTGDLYPFKAGAERIVERNAVPVIPMALTGLWGSFFSRYGGAAFSQPIGARLRRGIRARISLIVGEAVAAESASSALMRERVEALRACR